MNNKLKELSRYCCKPANEQEYEFIKTCARLGGVVFEFEYDENDYLFYSKDYGQIDSAGIECHHVYGRSLILVTQFCNILLKDESEFEFKPKVGEWCAVDYSNNGTTRVFFVDEIKSQSLRVSREVFNGEKSYTHTTFVKSNFATFRQPTPEEIQTAIDAWDDRVVIRNMSNVIKADDLKSISALDGYKFRLSEDCKTVEMVKYEVKCGFCVKPKNEKG